MSSRTPNTTPDTRLATPDGDIRSSQTITTKYDANISNSESDSAPQPACFTENMEELRNEFLNITPQPPSDTPVSPSHPPGTSTRTPPRSEEEQTQTYKYGALIDTAQIEAIEEPERDTSPQPRDSREFIVKGNYHSENRFFERADLTHEDAPDTLQEAWKQGVQVGIDHFDREDFYGYTRARYNEVANIVMLMNSKGMIETTLTVFEETMSLNTDHLHRCGNPMCGRLYDVTDGGVCCHWCGYSESRGRLPTEFEALPRTRTSSLGETTHGEQESSSTHSLDTECDSCGEVFNTLTRLRLHDC